MKILIVDDPVLFRESSVSFFENHSIEDLTSREIDCVFFPKEVDI